jgi:SulP family sulfate permease
VTVLNTYGNVFFAGASTLRKRLPSPSGTRHPVVVLRLRHQDRAGSTFLNVVDDYAADLRQADGKLILSGVSADLMDQMQRTGHLDRLGAENVFAADSVVHGSTEAAFAAGSDWLKQLRNGQEEQRAQD